MSSLLVIDWIFMKFPSATLKAFSVVLYFGVMKTSLTAIILEESQLTSEHSDKQKHLSHPQKWADRKEHPPTGQFCADFPGALEHFCNLS